MDPLQGKTGEEQAVFGVLQPDGTYKAVKGKMHFRDGRIVGLSLARGGECGVEGTDLAPTVMHLFSDINPLPGGLPAGTNRMLGTVLRFWISGGRVIKVEDVGTALVDMSDITNETGRAAPKAGRRGSEKQEGHK